jgi:hypothetical protein
MSSTLRCGSLDLAVGAIAGRALLRPLALVNLSGRPRAARAGK